MHDPPQVRCVVVLVGVVGWGGVGWVGVVGLVWVGVGVGGWVGGWWERGGDGMGWGARIRIHALIVYQKRQQHPPPHPHIHAYTIYDTHRGLLQELEEEVGDKDAHGGVQEKVKEIDGALCCV
jgi:hypothetical protein